MHILVVARSSLQIYTGARIRLFATLDALATLGSVDLITLNEPGGATSRTWADADALTPRGVDRIATVPRSPRRLGWADAARWLLRHDRPRSLLMADFRGEQTAVAALLDRRYDLVWCLTDRAFASMPPTLVGVPAVVDLIDWEGDRQVELARNSGWARTAAAKLDRSAMRKTYRGWTRTARLIVSSELDLRRLGVAGIQELPNCYPMTVEQTLPTHGDRSPTVTFIGFMGYGPNSDAAAWLCDEIAPTLRRAVPGASVRIVGAGWNRPLGEIVPGVTHVGPVESVKSELARADAICVPLRFGSGTRVKILEAWAHHLPVISTTVGAEGLHALHGEHLLIGNSVDELVACITRVVNDPNLRQHLVRAGHRLYESTYSSAAFQCAVTQIAQQTMA